MSHTEHRRETVILPDFRPDPVDPRGVDEGDERRPAREVERRGRSHGEVKVDRVHGGEGGKAPRRLRPQTQLLRQGGCSVVSRREIEDAGGKRNKLKSRDFTACMHGLLTFNV